MGLQKKLATLVGCNYPNTRNELHGCINDVLCMREILVSLFAFEPNNINLLIDDTPGSSLLPTGANIMKALNQMVDQAESGDDLFFHYSGHGTRIPSKHGFEHIEAIVPSDLNLITDVDFRQLVNRLPENTSFTILSDSCHSGGLIDKEKEQIGPSTTNFLSTSKPIHHPKKIAIDHIFDHLSSLSGVESMDIGAHLVDIFGNEASKMFFDKNDDVQTGRIHPDSGILLSGCQADETSADARPTEEGGKAYGAFSNALQMVLKENGTGSNISNRELVIKAREVLEREGFEQHPCLYCSDENADAPFLRKSN
ncbi:hypothetical protein ACHQM5_004078 [Ranunculus cassubicifolius]